MCINRNNDPTRDGNVKSGDKPNRRIHSITSFASCELRLSGMREISIFVIEPQGESANLSLYRPDFASKERDARILEERVTCPLEKMIALFNDCNVLKWDGFDGPHPKGLLDGTMFQFKLDLGDGRVVTAHGSQNFPSHFHDLTAGLYAIFREQGKDGHL